MSKTKYIAYYDEKLGKSFELPEFDLQGSTVTKFIKAHPSIFYATVLSALYNGINLNLPHVPVFCIKDSDLGISMSKKKYAEKIEACLTFFEGIEEFEFCKTLAELRTKLQDNEQHN